MNNLSEPIVFLAPGDVVEVRHNIENKPKMIVVEKVSRNVKTADNEIQPMFLGMRCRWFDKNCGLQEAIFNTKDLILVED